MYGILGHGQTARSRKHASIAIQNIFILVTVATRLYCATRRCTEDRIMIARNGMVRTCSLKGTIVRDLE